MIRMVLFIITLLLMGACKEANQQKSHHPSNDDQFPMYAMVIHGGAGTILKKNMTDEKEKAYTNALNEALSIGEKILKNGGTSADAVEKTINYLENSPLFNAGKGAVFTHHETNELDASLMYGNDLSAGAVGGVNTIKNPISAARTVLEKSEHVFMVGKGAEEFASLHDIEMVDPSYFYTERRYKSLKRIKDQESTELSESDDVNKKHGTVGAVALDLQGNIVAGTSTGGMTNKKYNRIGDSPIIGAGTYANNKTCGVSCTGHGEFFIRYAVAHAISSAMEYGNMNVQEAGDLVINQQLVEAGGTGGAIILDQNGNIAMPFNTEGMYRGYVNPHDRVIKIYKD